MTADHLQPLLDTGRDTSLLFRFATVLARGQAPDAAVEGVRMGRITALQKPDGGVRGIVVGDVLRSLVARTMAKPMAARVEAATAPFQYVLTTKAGCESVAHILQSLTDQDERATIVSIDGVVAYDLMSRNAMLEGMASVPGGDRLLPFVRHFYGSPSTYLWEDQAGVTHMIPQGEGGEQGDPLMPMLFIWGCPALVTAQERLKIQTSLAILKSPNRPRRGILRIFGCPTIVPRTCTCKKQIFGRTQYHGVGGHLFRHWFTDGILVLDLWDSVIGVPHSSVRGNS